MQEMAKIWYKKWWVILVITFTSLILIIAVAVGFYIFNAIKEAGNKQTTAQSLIKEKFIGDSQKIAEGDGNNYWMGSNKAKITIVEFADYTCPYCRNSFSTIREIGIKYKDSVKIIFRDYPIKETYSADLAMAGRCAGEQGLFWPMYDKLFQNQGISNNSEILSLVKSIGADEGRFSSCMNSKKYLPQIQKDFKDGQSLRISGTPTWFVNGYKIEGDAPLATWEEMINKLIK